MSEEMMTVMRKSMGRPGIIPRFSLVFPISSISIEIIVVAIQALE
jgi:hypothetical protein